MNHSLTLSARRLNGCASSCLSAGELELWGDAGLIRPAKRLLRVESVR